ncbi:hypothetical protein FRB93_003617 [Tulasnella sp. JGI-2019a]|nr:hypothetical protein FRB93_003617 [Tulasnella sp. JGI-2019a]
MFKLVVILLFLAGAASNGTFVCSGGIVDTSTSSSTAGIEHFIPKLASNASSIDTFIGPVSVNDQHLAGIPSCDAPYVHGVAAPTYTCRAVTVIPVDPPEGYPMDHHPRIRLKSVCCEWCWSWSAPTPIPVPAPVSYGCIDRDHAGTDTMRSPTLSFVDVALNTPVIDIRVDVDMTSNKLITIQPSSPVSVSVASISPTIDADVDMKITSNGLLANGSSAPAIVSAASTTPVIGTDRDNCATSQGSLVGQASVVECATLLVHGARNTDPSTVLLLLVAIVLFTLPLMASCVTLFFFILLRNKRDYKKTAHLRATINTLQYELSQRASTKEENIRLRKCANGLVDTVRALRDDLAVARDVSDQRQGNIGRPGGSSIDAPALPRPNA